MYNKISQMTLDELTIQTALGSLPEECRNNLCRYRTPEVSKGPRTCHFCGRKCISRGEEFYLIPMGSGRFNNQITVNVCKTCSWLPIQTINEIIAEYNLKSK